MSDAVGTSGCADSPLSEPEAGGTAEGMGRAIANQSSAAKATSAARGARFEALLSLWVEFRVDSLFTGFHSLEKIS